MAYDHNENFNTESFRAASNIQFGAGVMLDTTNAFRVVPASAASAGIAAVYGVAKATAASVGISLPVQTGGWAHALAGASLGIGAYVGLGIGTSSFVPFTPSGAIASYPKFVLGIALENASAGSLFTVKINPGLVM
jgi:hypothetical protein